MTAQYTDLPSFSGQKATRNAGGNSFGTHDKHVVPAWWGCGSFCMSGLRTSHRHLQRLVDWMGWARGLASLSHQTLHQLPMGPH